MCAALKLFFVVCLLFNLALGAATGVTSRLFREHEHDPLIRPLADAFSSRLAEVAPVKNPASILVVNNSLVYVSSFLDDAVLFATLPLSSSTRFRVFAAGKYCTPTLRQCAILNGISTALDGNNTENFTNTLSSLKTLPF
jgi:hypothetical protein